MKENGFTLKKPRSRQYPAEAITNADYADDLVLLDNTPTQAKCLLHSLEQATNLDKTEFINFKWDVAFSTLNGKPLTLEDHFIYSTSNILFTESNINVCIGKVWTAIIRLPTIWISDITDKIKQEFFQGIAM